MRSSIEGIINDLRVALLHQVFEIQYPNCYELLSRINIPDEDKLDLLTILWERDFQDMLSKEAFTLALFTKPVHDLVICPNVNTKTALTKFEHIRELLENSEDILNNTDGKRSSLIAELWLDRIAREYRESVLRKRIDDALLAKDEQEFYKSAAELRTLLQQSEF